MLKRSRFKFFFSRLFFFFFGMVRQSKADPDLFACKAVCVAVDETVMGRTMVSGQGKSIGEL